MRYLNLLCWHANEVGSLGARRILKLFRLTLLFRG